VIVLDAGGKPRAACGFPPDDFPYLRQ